MCEKNVILERCPERQSEKKRRHCGSWKDRLTDEIQLFIQSAFFTDIYTQYSYSYCSFSREGQLQFLTHFNNKQTTNTDPADSRPKHRSFRACFYPHLPSHRSSQFSVVCRPGWRPAGQRDTDVGLGLSLRALGAAEAGQCRHTAAGAETETMDALSAERCGRLWRLGQLRRRSGPG